MLRRAAQQLRPLVQQARGIAGSAAARAEGEAADSGSQAFLKKFSPHVSSTLAPPNFPTDFMKRKEIKEGEPVPDKMTMNFYLPHEQLFRQAKASPSLSRGVAQPAAQRRAAACRRARLDSQARRTCAAVQVDMALLPAVTGDFGVMPGHVPTVAQLRPGVLPGIPSALPTQTMAASTAARAADASP